MLFYDTTNTEISFWGYFWGNLGEGFALDPKGALLPSEATKRTWGPGSYPQNKKTPSVCLTFVSGERGIRTPGASQHGSFQDYCNRPLYHLSSALLSRKRVQR